MKPERKIVEIFVLDTSDKAKVCKIFREYADRPYSELLASIENSEAMIKMELVPEKFFSGIQEIIALVEKLESESISYRICVNGKIEEKDTLINIKEKVDNLSLKDFR